MKKTAKAKSSASKTAPAKKASAKKATTRAAKRSAAKKSAAKKTTAKKAAKKTAAKKSTAKKAAKKTAAKKTAAKKGSWDRGEHVESLRRIMADHWEFVDAWFADSDPEPDRRPEPPRAPKDASAALARWEKEYGEAFEDCLQAHFAGGLAHPSRSFMEYTLLELPQAYDRWSGLNDLVDQGVFKEAKPRALAEDQDSIRFVWWSRGFIPVAEDGGGNLMCADLDPGPGGTRGQIIKWEKTEGPLGPLAENIGAYLVDYRNSLEDGSLAFDESGFLERRKVRKKGSKTQEELFAAVEAGDAATVSRLLAADKTLLEVRNQYDEPLIIPAMQKKHTEVVRAFLDAGVDANTRGPSGSRILDYALSAQAAGTVALLLERGAIPLLDGKYGAPESIIASMLSSATFSDHAPEADYLSMLESLLRAGADPNVAWYGETPLMKAAQFGSMALVKRLLAAGASVDAVDDKGKTAAGHARSRRRKEVAAFLDSLAAR